MLESLASPGLNIELGAEMGSVNMKGRTAPEFCIFSCVLLVGLVTPLLNCPRLSGHFAPNLISSLLTLPPSLSTSTFSVSVSDCLCVYISLFVYFSISVYLSPFLNSVDDIITCSGVQTKDLRVVLDSSLFLTPRIHFVSRGLPAAKIHSELVLFSLSPLQSPKRRTVPSLAWIFAIASSWPDSSTFISPWSLL